jgi:hypothetical protein
LRGCGDRSSIKNHSTEKRKKVGKTKNLKKMPHKCSACCEKYASFATAGAEKPLRCGSCRIAGDVDVVRKKCGCGKVPSFGPRGGKVVHCAGCRVEGDVSLKSKMCSTCGEKRPAFAPTGAESALRCGSCRIAGDVDVVSKKCGCGKKPSFGPRGGKKVHCAGCRVEGDVDLINKMCTTCGEKVPSFAPAGAKRALRCGSCRSPGDVDVKNKRCGCSKLPSFGPRGGKVVHCAGCRVEGDVDLVSKMCSTCGEKQPSFAPAGAKRALRCGGCRVEGDVDVVSKKCGCGKQPSFGPVGGKAVHCAGCRVEGDVNLVHQLCTTCDEVQPSFAPPGHRATRCAGCRLGGDVNVISRMCSGCPKRATFGPAGGRAHRCGDCRIEGDVDVLSDVCTTCLAVTASYGTTSEGARRCAGCKLPGDVPKYKALCRSCFKNRPEYGPTPRRKPKTCSTCRTRGQLHRDSDWLWNMLVTREPRKKVKNKFRILWSEETLRDQLWWLKPQERVKIEVKEEPGVTANNASSSSSSTLSSSRSSSSSESSIATPHPQLEVLVKIEPVTESEVGEMQ